MTIETTTTSSASIAATWAALTDVSDWPRWTKSMTSVERLDEGDLRVGSRARVKQPGMPSMIWQVDDLRENEGFSWVATSIGVRVTGHHWLSRNPDGTTGIRLAVEQRGPLAGLVGALTGARTRRFIGMEAAGLKAASEAYESKAG
ncbi:hypothetical protein GCM10023322_71680 [Rugosimonospora acidiphila]|uniref:Polyketide cyclase / dehydrase and lipid transport n=1 Tax=Rugosimonospora acidiphila TaxID=556531 RepID=A0ABP9SN19_9ACTN